jgi:hemolysin activation/secretion protein
MGLQLRSAPGLVFARLDLSAVVVIAICGLSGAPALAATDAASREPPRVVDIAEYRIEGAAQVAQRDLEAAVYPFLGPQRSLEDVERARAAIEKLYSDLGYLAVSVSIPPQRVHHGVVTLKVTEGVVARLRVRGSRWFSLSEIKEQAPSVAEGKVPNANDIAHDIVALNQIPDRRVTPTIRASTTPGAIDVDLTVKDAFPLHGTLEVNNRYSANTTHTRLTGSIHYDNLWQLGHSLAFSFQIAPKQVKDAQVFSASYVVRIPSAPWLSFVVNGVAQNADVSTVGGIAVTGRGWIAGGRATFLLPSSQKFFHTMSTGIDFKRFYERLALPGSETGLASGLTYWPLSAQYGATWLGESFQTQLGATIMLNLRGLGATSDDFDAKRFKASASFLRLRAELSHTHRLPGTLELVFRATGQYASAPLVGAEQLLGGGVDSVRGYTEAQTAGDFGGLVSLELRSPNFGRWMDPNERVVNELRLVAFGEGGWLRLWEPLPEMQWISRLWGAGAGARFKFLRYVNGAVDVAVPLRAEGGTRQYEPRFLFRFWVEV